MTELQKAMAVVLLTAAITLAGAWALGLARGSGL